MPQTSGPRSAKSPSKYLIFQLTFSTRKETTSEHYFFRTIPKSPYSYLNKPDGADVGKYSPLFTLTKPRSKLVTKELFIDNRDPANRTLVIKPETKYPECTLNGTIYCDVVIRNQIRSNYNSPEGKKGKVEFKTPGGRLVDAEEYRRPSEIITQASLPVHNEQEDSSVKTEDRIARLANTDQRLNPRLNRHLFSSMDSPMSKIRAFESQITRD